MSFNHRLLCFQRPLYKRNIHELPRAVMVFRVRYRDDRVDLAWGRSKEHRAFWEGFITMVRFEDIAPGLLLGK